MLLLRRLAAAACGALLLCASCRSRKPFALGVAVPLTGDLGVEGQGILRAVRLAVEEAERAGRLPFPLGVEAFDDRADPKEAVNVANLLIADRRVLAVIGHYNSGCSVAAGPVYAKAGMAMVTPAASNPRVTEQQLAPGWRAPRAIFRLVPTDDLQAAYAARFAYERLRLRRVAVFHDRTTYGEGLAARFKQEFEALGGRALLFEGLSAHDRDFASRWKRLRAARPQGIYFGGVYTEAGLLLRELRKRGAKLPFLSGDGARTPTLYAVAGPAAAGAYFTALGVPVEYLGSAKAFVARYKRRYPGAELKPFDHFAYEAARIAIEAIRAAGTDRSKIVSALHGLHFEGILGKTSFDEKGDTLNRVVTMTRADYRSKSFPPVK